MNIVGLSIAFAAFIIIITQVNHELSFDRSYPKSGRIYRAELAIDSIQWTAIMSRPMVDVCIAASPAVESAALTQGMQFSTYMTYDKAGTKVGFKEVVESVYPGIVDVFDYEFVEGSGDVLKEPGKMIIPKSMATRVFGDESAMGHIITCEIFTQDTIMSFEIGGVYKDLPASSSVSNIGRYNVGDANLGDWGNSNYYLYLTLYPGSNPDDVAELMSQAFSRAEVPQWLESQQWKVRLVPIEDLYYQTDVDFDVLPKGNHSTTMILLSIALLIVAVAGINFVNFSTSLVPMRIKSINTQKVLGSPVAMLRLVMVLEGVGIALFAMLLSILWVDIASRTGMNQWLLASIEVSTIWPMVGLTALLSVAVGVIAGLYPAFYATSFAPALVLKGSFGLSRSGRMLRTALVGFQFVVSLGLIVGALFMHIQNAYMRDYDTGLSTEQVAIVSIGSDMAAKESTITDRLLSNPNIEDVAYAMQVVGGGDTYMTWRRDISGAEVTNCNFVCLPVSSNFCSVMDLEIVDGRNFNDEDDLRDRGTYIFNQTAAKAFGMTLESVIQNDRLPVGFVKDFNYASLRTDVAPMALYTPGNSDTWKQRLTVAYVKVNGDPRDAANHIRSVFAEIDPAYPIELNFYDEVFNNLYQKERKTTAQITLFSALAVVLSLIGVFGLVLFETQYRRKEIGVRKVLGATVGEILGMFSGSFIRIVLVCFVIAAPLAWWAITEWLKDFTHRTELHWWVFALSLAIVMLITMVTVVVQSWRAATTNPVNAFKSE